MGLTRNERAEGPVGGLVLFASAALLASAAAGAFLTLASSVEEQARDTGARALNLARTTVELRGLVGRLPPGGASLDALNLTLGLGPGSDPVDLGTLVLTLSNRSTERVLRLGEAPGPSAFTLAPLRDADGSLAARRLLNFDDLASLDADLSPGASDLGLPPRETLRVDLHPENGAPVRWAGSTPPTYGGKAVVRLV